MELEQLIAQMQETENIKNYQETVDANAFLAELNKSEAEEIQFLRKNAEYKAAIAAEYGEENIIFDDVLEIWKPLPYDKHDTTKYPWVKMDQLKDDLNEAKNVSEISLQLDLSEYEEVKKENKLKIETLQVALDGLSEEFTTKFSDEFVVNLDKMKYNEAQNEVTNVVQKYDTQIDELDKLLVELTKQQKYFYTEQGKMAGKDADLTEYEFESMINNYKESSDKFMLQEDNTYKRIEGWDIVDTEGLKSAYQEYLIKNPQIKRDETRNALVNRQMENSQKHLARIFARTQVDNFDLNALSEDPILQSEVISVLALQDPEDIFFALSQDTQGAITNIIKSIDPVWFAAAEKHYKAGMEIKNERFLDPALKQKHFDVFEKEIEKLKVTDDNLVQAFAIFQTQIAEATEQGDFDKYLKIIENHWGIEDLGPQFMDMMMPQKDSLNNLLAEATGIDLSIAKLYPVAYNEFSVQEGSKFKFDVNKAWDFLSTYNIADDLPLDPHEMYGKSFGENLPEGVGLISPRKKSPSIYDTTGSLRNYKYDRPNYNLATALTSHNSSTDRTSIIGTPLANNHYYEAFYDKFREEVVKIHPTLEGDIKGQIHEYQGIFGMGDSIFEQEQFYGDGFLFEYIQSLPEFEKHFDEIMVSAQAAGEYAQKAWMERALNDSDHKDHQTVLKALESAYNAYNNEDNPRYNDYLNYFIENSGYLEEESYPEVDEDGKTIRHKK